MKVLNALRVIIIATALISSLSYAAKLKHGDIIIFRDLGEENAVYVLHKADNYNPEQLLTYKDSYLPLYDMDHARKRIYLLKWYDHTYHYVDLKSPPYVIKELDFLPEGMAFTCAAQDGSCLILHREEWNDIYAEENPAIAKPRPGVGNVPGMLYRFNFDSEKVERLTYFYAQGPAWLSTDSKCLVYMRFGIPTEKGEKYTFVFCKADGTSKFDLRKYFMDYDPAWDWYGRGWQPYDLAPKAVKDPDLGNIYLAYSDRGRPPEEGYSDVFPYYTATIYYENGDLNCTIKENSIELPPGTKVFYLSTLYSTDKILYLYGKDYRGFNYLCSYDLIKGKFKKIPHAERFSYYVVY